MTYTVHSNAKKLTAQKNITSGNNQQPLLRLRIGVKIYANELVSKPMVAGNLDLLYPMFDELHTWKQCYYWTSSHLTTGSRIGPLPKA